MKERSPQIGFLLSQVGAYASQQFGKLLKEIDISPSHAGILRIVSLSEKISQKELADRLSILPSRLVVLIDELENKKLIERRNDPADRRSHMLHLSENGYKILKSLSIIAKTHSDQLGSGLTAEERNFLASILQKIAAQQGLIPNVHPGYQK